jgi:hypothetical protein
MVTAYKLTLAFLISWFLIGCVTAPKEGEIPVTTGSASEYVPAIKKVIGAMRNDLETKGVVSEETVRIADDFQRHFASFKERESYHAVDMAVWTATYKWVQKIDPNTGRMRVATQQEKAEYIKYYLDVAASWVPKGR